MSIIDKVKSSAAAAADKASSTAKTGAAIARLKVSIHSEEDKLNRAYNELGRLFIRDLDSQAEADMVEYNPWCEKAHDSLDAIARLNAELDGLRAQLRTSPEVKAAEAEPAAADEAPVEAEAAAEPEAAVEAAEAAVETAEEAAEPADAAPAEAAAEEPEEEDTSIFAD